MNLKDLNNQVIVLLSLSSTTSLRFILGIISVEDNEKSLTILSQDTHAIAEDKYYITSTYLKRLTPIENNELNMIIYKTNKYMPKEFLNDMPIIEKDSVKYLFGGVKGSLRLVSLPKECYKYIREENVKKGV